MTSMKAQMQAQIPAANLTGAVARSNALPLKIVALQAGIAAAVAAVLLLVASPALEQAGAALLAGVCVVVPGLAVALLFARPVDPQASAVDGSGAASVAMLMMSFLAVLVLMALVFALLKPPALGFFSALVATQVAPVIAPALQDAQRRKAR